MKEPSYRASPGRFDLHTFGEGGNHLAVPDRGAKFSFVKLYVCYGTYGDARHPCGRAHKALTAAGYEPEIIKTYGCFGSDKFWKRRQVIKDMTGNYKVPTLVLDDGSVVDQSQNIVDWAASHPAERPHGDV
jgi:hypothetical protein